VRVATALVPPTKNTPIGAPYRIVMQATLKSLEKKRITVQPVSMDVMVYPIQVMHTLDMAMQNAVDVPSIPYRFKANTAPTLLSRELIQSFIALQDTVQIVMLLEQWVTDALDIPKDELLPKVQAAQCALAKFYKNWKTEEFLGKYIPRVFRQDNVHIIMEDLKLEKKTIQAVLDVQIARYGLTASDVEEKQ
jgi:hypothetical protein